MAQWCLLSLILAVKGCCLIGRMAYLPLSISRRRTVLELITIPALAQSCCRAALVYLGLFMRSRYKLISYIGVVFLLRPHHLFRLGLFDFVSGESELVNSNLFETVLETEL